MSKRKAPLSAAEKRAKLLELLLETSDVYQLKDLERIAPKEKGIVMQSIKECIQELVDSGQVRSEKIAGSIYYWAFPSDALNSTKQQLQQVEAENAQLDKKIEYAQQQLAAAEKAKENADETEALEHEIEELKKEKQELEERVRQAAGDIDYAVVAAKKQDAAQILTAANRWTDNIFCVKSWCKRKFDKEERELNKAFGIPEELDYIND